MCLVGDTYPMIVGTKVFDRKQLSLTICSDFNNYSCKHLKKYCTGIHNLHL